MKTENVMQVSIQVPDDQSTLQVHQAPQRPNLPISDALQIKAAEYWLKLGEADQALKELEAKGIRLIDKVPRMGAGGKKIAFVHPKDTYGVLVELCQKV